MNKAKGVRFQNNSGQALTEYVVLIAIATVIAVTLASAFVGLTREGSNIFTAVLERDLRTGGFGSAAKEPVTIWKN
ncbi:MAG: hypothetical protein AB7F43_14245 [Bacteriovoracia bacterium]